MFAQFGFVHVKERMGIIRGLLLAQDIEDLGKHQFNEPDIVHIREQLLAWYDSNQRKLPWRKVWDPNAKEEDSSSKVQQVYQSKELCAQMGCAAGLCSSLFLSLCALTVMFF